MLGPALIAGASGGLGRTLGGSRAQWIVAVLLALSVLVIGLGGLIAWLRRWGSAPAAQEQGRERICPTCGGEYPATAQFCPRDASPLAWAHGDSASLHLRCPRCEREYEGQARFCAMDAEPLQHIHHEVEDGAGDEPGEHARTPLVDVSGSAMICPVCAARYRQLAAYCGRDGTRLSPLN